MKTPKQWLSLFLSLTLLLSLLPGTLFVRAEEAQTPLSAQTQATDSLSTTRAISASDVSVPSYSGGDATSWMTYDCGFGSTYGDTGTQSKMRIVNYTSESQFNSYCSKLESNGYSRIYSNSQPGNGGNNLFAKFLAKDGTHCLYTYYLAVYEQVRIIVDTHKDTFGLFSYTPTGPERTELYMYGLSGAEDGFSTGEEDLNTQYRSNAGAMLILKMSDNSLFVIDGGGSNQMGDRSCDDLYAFLRRITGIPEGEKIVVNTWFISHYDGDHCGGFARFLHKYQMHFDVLNTMYNLDGEGSLRGYARRVSRMYPNMKYYKAHTGQSFQVSGVKFDVLYTVEDRYKANSNYDLILEDSSSTNYPDGNDTSMVLRVNMDGKILLLTGDLNKADNVLMKVWPASALKADLMQIPHHGFDNHTTLVKTVAPKISFLNQVESAVRNCEGLYNNNRGWAPYAGTIYYGGTHIVGYAADEGVFLKETFTSVSNLDWATKSYLMWEANPYNEEEKVKSNEQYYRYTKVDSMPQEDHDYLIVDPKVNRVLSYNIAKSSATSAKNGLYDGENWYFSASSRQYVNWIIHRNISASNSSSALPDAVTTYSDGVPIRKGTGGYWTSGNYNREVVLGNNDSFSYAGLFDSFSSFPNQIESAAKWTWIDVLKDGSFLIYRHASGTYYPLYRDGNLTSSGGWGTAALSASTVRNHIDYIKTHLYRYEETPGDMYLTWTGHKDYYCFANLRKEDVISLLAADIRVKWNIDAFGASGESLHTTRGEKNPGEYWFEFSPDFTTTALGEYSAKMIYKNADGSLTEVGKVNIHVIDRDPADPTLNSLYFDFGHEVADRYRYKVNSQYGEVNYDGSSRWRFRQYVASPKSTVEIPGEVDDKNGVLTMYKVTDTDSPNSIFMETYALSATPLNFNPKKAEVMQLRFKLDNLKALEDINPFFRLWYFTEDGSRTYDRSYSFGKDFVSDGKYMTLTLDLFTQKDIDANASVSGFPQKPMSSLSKVSGIQLSFHEFRLTDSSKNGSVTLDYFYLGPRSGLPSEEPNKLLFHFDNTEEAQQRYENEIYNGHNFDRPEKPNWAAALGTEDKLHEAPVLQTEDSYLSLSVPESGEELWLSTTAFHGYFPKEEERFRQPLAYIPEQAEVVQIRFKTEGCSLAQIGKAPTVAVIYDRLKDGLLQRNSTAMTAAYSLANDKHITLTFPLTEDFRTADFITSLGFRFTGLKGVGNISVDYIYVGPEQDAPMEMAEVTFLNHDGAVLYYARVPAGSGVAYEGEIPTKAPSDAEHFTFTGWLDREGKTPILTEVTEDLILTASYEATAHSFCVTNTDAQSHTKACPCGYSRSYSHNWDEGTLLSHPCTTDGVIRYTCSDCGAYREDITPMAGHKTVVTEALSPTCTTDGVTRGEICTVCGLVLEKASVLPATGHNKITVAGKAPTCVSSGLSDMIYCSLCHEVFAQQTVLPRLGHSYSYRDNGNSTHTLTCSRCAKSITESHNTENGSCVCGATATAVDSSLKLNHTLDLASDISLNYALPLSLLEGYDLSTVSLRVRVSYYEGNTFTGEKTLRLSPVRKGSYYYFILDGLTAVQMNDILYAVLKGSKNGVTYISPVDSYSIATYAYSQLDKATASHSLKTLCADLLRYGAKAQIYKLYRTDALADSAMTEEHRAYLSDLDAVSFGNTNLILNDSPNAPILWEGKALNLEGKVSLKFIFSTANYTADPLKLSLKLSYTDVRGTVQSLTLTEPEVYNGEKKLYSFSFDGLLASELRSVLSVQVMEGSTPVSSTLQYSADTYGNNKTGDLLTLCKALFAYSDSAKAYS